MNAKQKLQLLAESAPSYHAAFQAVNGYRCAPTPDGVIEHYRSRGFLRSFYSFAVPTAEVIAELAKLGPIVEVGAGAGYWAMLLQQAGADVIAYDRAPQSKQFTRRWTEIRRRGPRVAQYHPDRALLLCWPPYNTPMAYEALQAYRGQTVIYVGEGHSGCTGDDRFHELLSAEWERVAEYGIPQWDNMCDDVTVYRRR